MIELLLDSSNVFLSVGLSKDHKILDYVSYEAWQSQSEYMIQEIDKLLNKHHISKDDISGVIVNIGPGSYTGIRISLTIAKVMCLALNIPLYALSSLRALQKDEEPSICLMNARSNRSYIGVYDKEVILPDQVMSNGEVKEYIASHPQYIVCGDTKYLGIEGYNNNIIFEMNLLKDKAKKYDDSLGVKPVYLKD
ncbi:MAG: tRNA (adenosine(37)-N6)-threonylcarbamoyltransferase complex dimerization subunit type 1 TsaB [Bacilli bacterium]|nr:tRNA (adenosine(37)-N6)-threonylcarbamoyltransferase complex dimerization subunit type 1 TsaB [Bacilli bacterium]